MNLSDPNEAVLVFTAVLAASGVQKLGAMVRPLAVKAWNAVLRALTIEETE
jgi:hypothetical protein